MSTRASSPIAFEDCIPSVPLYDGDIVYVCKVYDGDTATLSWVDHTGQKVRSPCRIRDIDTPEMRSKVPQERDLAKEAKIRLQEAIMNKFVKIRNPSKDKYGRILADLSMSDCESVAEYMLQTPHLCKRYSGRQRPSWTTQTQDA